MAAVAGRWLFLRSAPRNSRPAGLRRSFLTEDFNAVTNGLIPRRTAVATRTGALLPKPEKVPFGLVRVFAVVVPFLYLGCQISKNFAALLEEHDIFVPEDDDDDD
ncbi:essential MCU regulator, mitochondrial [Protopterus annectens]|uniref:essential MCU regulator, mitochondrial n=1 Tax=Protopterus annectens TaxID=7888 RepID=UPI001CF99537|nr:essential MCU regulator, mitochondrial [Protopterus annectens]